MERKPSTAAVHGGEEEHPLNSVAVPVFQTAVHSMKRFSDLRRHARGEAPDLFLYTRGGNPTVEVAASKIAELESADAAVVTSSGTAAAFLIAVSLLRAGDEIVAIENVYGGTYKLMRDVLPRLDIRTRFLPQNDLGRLEALVTERSRLLWLESPTNPLNRIVDIEEAVALARKHRLISVIDNTLASPINQRPILSGVDLVMHSATKYLSGHSDVIAGAVCGRAELVAQLRSTLAATGGILDPGAAALLVRGMKTLDVRVERVNENAQKLAEFLESHPKVGRVYYAGLESSPFHAVARKQMKGFGGIVSIDFSDATEAAVERFCDSLRMVKIATSLGGTETIVAYPIYTSHTGFSEDELKRAGIGMATIRFSVGIESVDDLIADVSRAFEAV